MRDFSSTTIAFFITCVIYALGGGIVYAITHNTESIKINMAGDSVISLSLSQISAQSRAKPESKTQNLESKITESTPKPTKKPPQKIPLDLPKELNSNADVTIETQELVQEISQTQEDSTQDYINEQSSNTPTDDDKDAKNQGLGDEGEGEAAFNAITTLSSASGDPYARAIYDVLLKHYYYPTRLRQKNIKGEVKVQFSIDKSGTLKNYKILDRSPYLSLNDLSISILQDSASSFPPFFTQDSNKSQRTFIITFGFGRKEILK